MFVSTTTLSAKWRSTALIGLLALLPALRSVSCSRIQGGAHHWRARSLQDGGSSPEALAESWQSKDPDMELYSDERNAQRYALVFFHFATAGFNWTQQDGWLAYNVSECEWFSTAPDPDTVCDADGKYLSLHMNSNNLVGSLPTSLGVLTTLNLLNVSQNSVSGLLPSDISKLVALRTLDVGDNDLNGTIPTEVGVLTTLNHLNMSQNSISGLLPSDISKLVDLRTFDVGRNDLTGPIPSEIGQATSLTFFALNENRISSKIPTEIGLASNLVDILLQNNMLIGFIPSEMGLIRSELGLRRLDVDNNVGLNGMIPSEIGAISNLEELSVDGTEVNIESIPPEFCDGVGVRLTSCPPVIHATGYVVAWHSRGRGLTVSPDFQPENYGCQDPAPIVTASCGSGGRISIVDLPSSHVCNKTNARTVVCEPQGIGHVPLRCDTDGYDMDALVLNATLSTAPALSCNGCINRCDYYGGDAVQRLFVFTNCNYDGLFAMEDSCSGTRRLDENGNRFCEIANGCQTPAVNGSACSTNLPAVVVSSIGHFETQNGNGCVYVLSELTSVPYVAPPISITPTIAPSITPSVTPSISISPSSAPSDKPPTGTLI